MNVIKIGAGSQYGEIPTMDDNNEMKTDGGMEKKKHIQAQQLIAHSTRQIECDQK